MTLNEIYRQADESDIEVARIYCPNSGSMSVVSDSGACYIGIDDSISDSREELVCVAHELGHCKTGAFYNRYSRFNVISKLERKADKWAALSLIPPDELENALNNGYTELWQLAELFGVTEQFVARAYEIYQATGDIAYKYSKSIR